MSLAVTIDHHQNGFKPAEPAGSENGVPQRAPIAHPWAKLSDVKLMAWRMCDLGLSISGTVLQKRIERLYDELAQRGLRFRPHCWLSDEWFSPDGVPGIAIPFYLAHPRLARLERMKMLEVEGGNEDWCMKILRHEAGHAIDTAYRLHQRKRYREIFGNYRQPYPEHYYPKPYSKNYVLHLEPSYAQAHPAEDFAETFAVWLKPRSTWRAAYGGWPVMKKLEYMAQLMDEIRDQKPAVASRAEVEPLRRLKKTLGEHYAQKRERYRFTPPNLHDQSLRKLFSDDPQFAGRPSAAAFLRRHRAELRKAVARGTGEYQYTIDQVLSEMIHRCRQLNLRLHHSADQSRQDALILVTMQTMNYLRGGHHRVVM